MTTPTQPVPDFLDNAACDPVVTWTTGNVAEAFPGVFTTLGFSYVHRPMEFAFRRTFQRLGVYPTGRVSLPTRIEDQFWTVFAGRGAGNIDQFRRIAALTPGTSATAVEKQLFGYVRPATVDRNSYRRYPVIAVKAPWTLGTLPKRHDAMFAQLRAWRLARLRVVPGLDEDGCLALLADARARFESMMTEHMIVAFASSGLAERLTATVAGAELPGLEAKLLSGVGSDEKGVPEVTKVAGAATRDAAAGLVITGVAASGGVAEGRARVVRDPADTELDDGDILVCETTDPGWVSLFLVAGGVVTDFGGLLSHGPIVARELGIPCVCGTEDGSNRIRDGQRIRVDGDRGTVEVLS
jgi:phosphohistidine swiveling domain-containing protein